MKKAMGIAVLAVCFGCPKTEASPPPPPASPPPAAPAPAVENPPSGPNGKLTWKDVQPVFADDCDRCHGANPRPGNWVAKAKRQLDTSAYPFGGEHGAEALDLIIDALQVDPSGRRKMPMDDRTGFPEAKAQKVIKWIMDGALDAEGKSAIWPSQAH